MNRTYFTIVISIIALTVKAENIMLPSYYTRISLEEGGVESRDTSMMNILSFSPIDERFTVSVIHDSLTEERIKAIKRNEAVQVLSGIASAAGAFAAFSSTMAIPLTPLDAVQQSINYTNGMTAMASSAYLAMAAKSRSGSLKLLPVTIFIQNNTENELYVNDTERGLVWYIRAYGSLMLSVGNPEINCLRIAYADSTAPKVCYAVIEACNHIGSYNLSFENEDYYYLNWTENFSYTSDLMVSMFRRDKKTNETIVIKMTKKEAVALKKLCK